jgi:hypothetical protein
VSSTIRLSASATRSPVAPGPRQLVEDLDGAAARQLPAHDLVSLPTGVPAGRLDPPGAGVAQKVGEAVVVAVIARELEHAVGEAQRPTLQCAGDLADHDAPQSGHRNSGKSILHLPSPA